MNSLEPRRKTSWHLADLQDKSAPFINQVIQDLNVTPTDLKESKRAVTVARYTAAKMIADSWECKNAALYNLVMERTEGKVPDVRFNFGGDDIIKRLETARARMISDGAISDSTLQLEASDAATGDLDAADPTPAACTYNIDTPADDQTLADCQSIDTSVNVPRETCQPVDSQVAEPVPDTGRGDLGSIEAGGGSGDSTPEIEIPVEPIQSVAEIRAELPAKPPRVALRKGPKPKVRVKTAPARTREALARLLAEDEQTANTPV